MEKLERLVVDLEKLDPDYPVQIRGEVMPDGSVHEMPVWDAQRLASMLRHLPEGAWAGKAVVYTGLPPCWAIAAADHKGKPVLSCDPLLGGFGAGDAPAAHWGGEPGERDYHRDH